MNSGKINFPSLRHYCPLRPWRFDSAAAFTLVELMVVLAIIAGLMLLMVPNVRRHQARARSTQCQNNLRQYGIAMAQYMVEWNGYFVFPGGRGASSIGRVHTSSDYDASGYTALRSHGARSGSDGHVWGDFVAGYVPTPEITGDFLRSGQNCVRICPEVTREVFLPTDPKHKGYRTEIRDDIGEVSFTDFEIDYSTSETLYQSETEVHFEPYFTTYGINQVRLGANGQVGSPAAYRRPSSNIPSRVVAFIDWNAEEGWGANIVPTNNVWQYDGQDREGNEVKQGDPKDGEWWHRNRVLSSRQVQRPRGELRPDGSVHSVSSNEISVELFR